MIEQIIYFFPLASLLIGIFYLSVFAKKSEEVRLNFHIARISLTVSWVFSVIFFNKSAVEHFMVGNHFTLLCVCLMYASAFMLMFLAEKWFLSMKIETRAFCVGVLMTVLMGNMLICSVNFGLTVICLSVILLNQLFLLHNGSGKKQESEKFYLYAVLISIGLLIFAICCLHQVDHTLFYEGLRQNIKLQQENVWIYVAVISIITVFIFLLGLAPLHFGATELLGGVTLPVFTYFMLIPYSACLAGLIHLNIYVFAPLLEKLHIFYTALALISVGFGAVGACSGQNIRKIFAYSALYHLAAVFLILQRFSFGATVMAMAYYMIYLLTMHGICACLFGLKVKGEYLYMVNEFNGAARKRPYLSAMMVIFLFSLLGFPPLMGFWGTASVFGDLIGHRHLYQMWYLCAMIPVVSYAYLQIVRALYFEEGREIFDRADLSIYTAICLDIIGMLLIILNPHYLTNMLSSAVGDLFI